MIIGKSSFYRYWKSTGSFIWKKKRYHKIFSVLDIPQNTPLKILELGCANGKDFIQFLPETYEVWGIDLNRVEIKRKNFHFLCADAESLPFPDKSFDLVVSIGLLEHIEPIEKLCHIIQEIDRVGIHHASIIPSISNIIRTSLCKTIISSTYT